MADKAYLARGLMNLRNCRHLHMEESQAVLEYIGGLETLLEELWDRLASARELKRSELIEDIEGALGADWVPQSSHR